MQHSLESLKKEAKRWLKDIRANDEEAQARFHRAHPEPPAQPTLRDVQHALAREHRLSGWAELKTRVDSNPADETSSWFLQQACPDWRLGGPGAQAAAQQTAIRLLDRHPKIARDSLYTAIVCGELAQVERFLTERPQAATESGGVKEGWQPLHYLCFTRLPLAATNDHAVAIARALLDRGADPNASFQIGNARHSPLVGVIGEGEERRPAHPQAEALVRLLLERGANPRDQQVLYNVNQGDNPFRWLELLYEHSATTGQQMGWTAAWPNGLSDFDLLLSYAVSRNDLAHAEWLLARGANPNATPKRLKHSLHETALRKGFDEMAEMLVQSGATPTIVNLNDEEAFVEACLRLDRDAVQAMLLKHPEFLGSHVPIFTAAEQDRADVVAFLLDRGVPIEIEDQQKQRPLHAASSGNAVRAAQLLIDRGAEIDPHESNWNATPLGYAVYGQKREMIDLLSRFTHDVFELTLLAKVGRLRELLRAQPELAKARDADGGTPLMWVREDAPELIELLLVHGADPAVELKDGTTAEDLLRKRGLYELANILRWRERIQTADPNRAEQVASFLRMASLDWRTGGPDRARQMHAAARLLQKHPEIARDSIYTAVVCGDLAHVKRLLAERRETATEPGGPRGWPPLLYLCNARLPMPPASDNAVAIARVLLDAGADPNVYYPGGNPSIHYSALTSVMGRGEEQGTLHPQAEALAGLLLERGAEPYDIQVLYNVFAGHASQRHLGEEAIWLMELMYKHSLARGREADWKDPNWRMLGMGGYGGGAWYLLSNAIAVNHLGLVEWVLAHGANPNAAPPPRGHQVGLYERAVLMGRTEIAGLLLRFGADGRVAELSDEDAFAAACLRLDSAEVQTWIAKHPEYLQLPRPMAIAAQTDRADVVQFLLDLGMSPDVEDPKQGRSRPLHWAAYYDSARVVRLLIDRGAEIDFFDEIHDGTALWWAIWGQKPRTVDLLSPLSRDVWSLTVAGKVERLREVLDAEPRLAKVTHEQQTPLFWLPDDEKSALAIVELFLAHGVDRALKNKAGLTAADMAKQRGLEEAAALLRA